MEDGLLAKEFFFLFFFLLEAFSLVVDVACLNLKKGKTAMEEYLSKK
jgi:hypothetical protein